MIQKFVESINDNNVEKVQKFLQEGVLLSLSQEDYACIEEAQSLSSKRIYKLIEEDINLHKSLIQAILNSDIEEVKKTLSKGASINFVNYDDEESMPRTALEYATMGFEIEVNTDIVKYLIDFNESFNNIGEIAYNLVNKGEFELLKLLYEKGFDVNYISYDATLLRVAIEVENIPIINFLLDKGANPFLAPKIAPTCTAVQYVNEYLLFSKENIDKEIVNIFREKGFIEG